MDYSLHRERVFWGCEHLKNQVYIFLLLFINKIITAKLFSYISVTMYIYISLIVSTNMTVLIKIIFVM